jgi:hypothetical protein
MQKLYETIKNDTNETVLSKPTHMSCQFIGLTDGIKNSYITGIQSKEFRTVE